MNLIITELIQFFSHLQYSNRGTLSGGYSDPSKRKLPLYRQIKELQKKLRQKTVEFQINILTKFKEFQDELERNHTKMMELKGRVDGLMSSIADVSWLEIILGRIYPWLLEYEANFKIEYLFQ